jgi:hypothetical protein
VLTVVLVQQKPSKRPTMEEVTASLETQIMGGQCCGDNV